MWGRMLPALALDERRSPLGGAVAATLAIAVCTGVIYPIKAVAPPDSLGVVYILAVLVVAANWGALLGVLTAPRSTTSTSAVRPS